MEFYARTIVREADLFDGSTEEDSSTGYTPQKPGGNAMRIFKTGPAVGAFSPADLGSTDKDRPLVVWYKLIGEPLEDSRVEIHSAFTGDTNADYPANLLLQTLPLRTTDYGPFILGPTDRICVFHERPAAIEYRVLSFTDAARAGILEACCNNANNEGSCCDISEITLTQGMPDDETLENWVGTRILYVTMEESGGNVFLPELADVDLGARIFVVRRGGEWFNLAGAGAGTEPINGGTAPGRIIFHQDNYGVWLEAGSETWTATHDTRTYNDDMPADPGQGQPIIIPPWPTGSVFTCTYPNETPKVIRLPPVTDQAPGAWALFTVGQTGKPVRFELTDPVEEQLDHITGANLTLVNPGDTMWIMHNGANSYLTVLNVHDEGAQPVSVPNVNNVVLTENWPGSRFVNLLTNGALPQTLILPDPAPAIGRPAEIGQQVWVSAIVDGSGLQATNATITGRGNNAVAAVNDLDAFTNTIVRWDGTTWRYI